MYVYYTNTYAKQTSMYVCMYVCTYRGTSRKVRVVVGAHTEPGTTYFSGGFQGRRVSKQPWKGTGVLYRGLHGLVAIVCLAYTFKLVSQ